MAEIQKQTPNSDEIDLVYIFTKIGDFFRNIGLGIMRFLAALRRVPLDNKALFIILIMLGLAGGISYATLMKKQFYSSSMILSSEYINKRIIDNTIQNLNQLAREEGKKGLAEVLQIPEALASNIHDFEAKPFIEEKELVDLKILTKDLNDLVLENENEKNKADKEKAIKNVIDRIQIENRHSFEITIRVYSPTVMHELEKTLVNYLKNNEYLKKRVEATKKNRLEKQQKLLKDSRKLDSLKTVIYANYQSMANQPQSRQAGGSNNVILADRYVTNPIEVYELDTEIYNELQEINRSLYLQNDFEVVAGFTQFSSPSSASPVQVSIDAFLIAIGVGYLLVALSRLNRYLGKLA